MERDRLEDYSVLYWLRSLFSAYPQVTIADGYPDADLVLPSIVVEADEIKELPFEQGTRELRTERIWMISVFASNKAQRDDFSSYIRRNLKSQGIPVYDYNNGFPPSSSPPQIDTLVASDIVSRPIRIFPQLVEKLYWRNTITFLTERLGG